MTEKSFTSYQPSRMPLAEAILHIRENAAKKNISISDQHIADVLGITVGQLNQYINENRMPDNLFEMLEQHFREFYTLFTVTSVQYDELPDPSEDE